MDKKNKYWSYMAYSPIGIAVFDQHGNFIDVNDKASEILGYSIKELLPLNIHKLLLDFKKSIGMDSSLINQISALFNPTKKFTNKNGEEFYLMIEIVRISHDRHLCYITDITLKAEVEFKLQESEDKFRNLVMSAKDAIILADQEGRIVLWNHQAKNIFGYSTDEVLNKEISDLIIPEKYITSHNNAYRDFSETGMGDIIGKNFDVVAIDKNKREFDINMTLTAVNLREQWHSLAIIRDISEQKLMEAKLHQSGKMATLGEMATGIAHEINQPLSIIGMGAQMLDMAMQKEKMNNTLLKDQIQKFIKNVARASKIINHLRIFGRKASGQMLPYSINVSIANSIEMVENRLKNSGIEVKLNLAQNLPDIIGEESSIEQVFVNILLNAIDALKESNKDQKEILINSAYNADEKMVVVDIGDNGKNIPPDVIDKIFEPFYTTKPTGKGTGLGLSISYGIVQSQKGSISAKNTAKGPVFTVNLPVFVEPEVKIAEKK